MRAKWSSHDIIIRKKLSPISSDSALTKTIFPTTYLCFLFAELISNPDEARLRKHLFDSENKTAYTEDLMTTPVANVEQIMNVSVSLYIIKLIGLVKTKPFLFSDSDKPSCRS